MVSRTINLSRNFFWHLGDLLLCSFVLAPKWQPSKIQQQMASSLEDLKKFDLLSNKFESFLDMMKQSLDKWSGMEAWRMTAGESFDALLQRTTTVAEQVDSATARIHHLEHHPPPPLPPPPLPQAFPQPHVYPTGLDLNLAPHPSPRTSEVDSDRPSGHRPAQDHRVLGGGILRPPTTLGHGYAYWH